MIFLVNFRPVTRQIDANIDKAVLATILELSFLH